MNKFPARLSVILGLVSLLSGGAGVAGATAVAKAQLAETVAKVAQIEQDREREKIGTALRLQALEIESRYQTAALERIERKLGTR